MPHLSSKEMKIADHENAPREFNDLCDNVIDMICCHLRLEDLTNIADTSTRLKGIAGGVFSRRHAHRLIAIDAIQYAHNLFSFEPKYSHENIYIRFERKAFFKITDARIWFKVLRNFGGSIKYILIRCYNERDTHIAGVLQNLITYVSEFCCDSLNTLELYKCTRFILNKPLKNLQEFFFITNESFENAEALELMPNICSLVLHCVPRNLEKSYAKLERVKLSVKKDDDVHSFISFLRMNKQIKYLKLVVACRSEHHDSIFSSIAENLPQLRILKLHVFNSSIVTSTYRFKTLESFSIEGLNPREFSCEFNELRKFTIDVFHPDWLNILRNKKLKILKIHHLSKMWLEESIIRKFFSELPELALIIVYSYENENYWFLKNILGREWEQFEVREADKRSWKRTFQRFYKKIDNQ